MKKFLLVLLSIFVAVWASAAPASAGRVGTSDIDRSNDVEPGGLGESLVYGWRWAQPVDVYDGTAGGALWDVPETVAEWDKTSRALVVRMTTDPAAAEVVVYEVASTCGVGCAYLPPVTNGIAYGQCRVELVDQYRTWPVAEVITLHEVGHCIGLAHAPSGTRSVMTPTVSPYDFLDRPTAYDRNDVRSLYGR